MDKRVTMSLNDITFTVRPAPYSVSVNVHPSAYYFPPINIAEEWSDVFKAELFPFSLLQFSSPSSSSPSRYRPPSSRLASSRGASVNDIRIGEREGQDITYSGFERGKDNGA